MSRRCKFCNCEVWWKRINGKNVMFDSNREIHECLSGREIKRFFEKQEAEQMELDELFHKAVQSE